VNDYTETMWISANTVVADDQQWQIFVLEFALTGVFEAV
jgi:hypothetical protein